MRTILLFFISCLCFGCSDFLDEVDKDKLIPTTTDHYAAVLLNCHRYDYPLFNGVEYMLQHAEGEERLYYLNLYLEQIRTTVFRQMLFAEFELMTHAAVEKGEVLTADKLESIWMQLNRTYYGENVILDPELAAEWSRIPHFYRPFYVYQYATGYAAAMTLSHNLRTKGAPAQDAYLSYLASGGSDYSISLLQRAGVDMTTPAPFQITFQKFTDCLNELDQLTR